MLRLFGLLGMLGFGFIGVSLLAPSEVKRADLGTAEPATSAEPETPAPPLNHLPEAVRRLADPVQATPLRPVVFGEPTPIPTAAPRPAEAPQTKSLRDPNNPFRTIKAQRANVRSGPSTGYAVIGQLSRGEEVEVLERDGAWLLVRLQGDGFEGWISATLLAE